VNSSLFLLKKMNQKSRENLLSHIFPINRPNSIDIMFGFAIDLLSSLIANGNRGYRIALLQVGEITNNLYNSLSKYKDIELVQWHDYNDNSVTFHSGLNIRLCPIVS